MFKQLQSKIIVTNNSHWRTTPATTDTFCISRENLIKHKDAIIYFSSQLNYSLDYQRSLHLSANGLTLWSCLPGYSSHIVNYYLSPLTNWETI